MQHLSEAAAVAVPPAASFVERRKRPQMASFVASDRGKSSASRRRLLTIGNDSEDDDAAGTALQSSISLVTSQRFKQQPGKRRLKPQLSRSPNGSNSQWVEQTVGLAPSSSSSSSSQQDHNAQAPEGAKPAGQHDRELHRDKKLPETQQQLSQYRLPSYLSHLASLRESLRDAGHAAQNVGGVEGFLSIFYGVWSEKGPRKQMEDSHMECLRLAQGRECGGGESSSREDFQGGSSSIAYFGLFDGHRGWRCSNYAKAEMHKVLRTQLSVAHSYKSQADCASLLAQAFARLDHAYHLAFPKAQDGSTGVVCLVECEQMRRALDDAISGAPLAMPSSDRLSSAGVSSDRRLISSGRSTGPPEPRPPKPAYIARLHVANVGDSRAVLVRYPRSARRAILNCSALPRCEWETRPVGAPGRAGAPTGHAGPFSSGAAPIAVPGPNSHSLCCYWMASTPSVGGVAFPAEMPTQESPGFVPVCPIPVSSVESQKTAEEPRSPSYPSEPFQEPSEAPPPEPLPSAPPSSDSQEEEFASPQHAKSGSGLRIERSDSQYEQSEKEFEAMEICDRSSTPSLPTHYDTAKDPRHFHCHLYLPPLDVRNLAVVALTRDHKPSDPDEKLRITQAGGTVVMEGCMRVQVPPLPHCLAVSRSFGNWHLKAVNPNVLTAVPDTTSRDLIPFEDQFIILATDGVWDVCSNEDAARIVAQALNERERVAVERREYVVERKENGAEGEERAGRGGDAAERSVGGPRLRATFLHERNWATDEGCRIAAKALATEALARKSLDNVTVTVVRFVWHPDNLVQREMFFGL